MKKPNKTSPTSNVVSSDILEKKRRLKELTRPRECLSMAFSDDSLPILEPEPKSSIPTSNETNAAKDALLSQTANQHDVGKALDWWKIALEPNKEELRKYDPDLMRRAEMQAKYEQKLAQKRRQSVLSSTDKPSKNEWWKIALSPDKEALRKVNPDLMRRAERMAAALEKQAQKRRQAVPPSTDKPSKDEWWKIALEPNKEELRKHDPDLMRRAERRAAFEQKLKEKQQTATTPPTEKPMPGESWARFHKRKAEERGEEE